MDVAVHCLRFFESAQRAITERGTLENPAGQTTMFAGAVVPLGDDEGTPRWRLIAAGVGDCKAYHISASSGNQLLLPKFGAFAFV
jgi:hypothetical protein